MEVIEDMDTDINLYNHPISNYYLIINKSFNIIYTLIPIITLILNFIHVKCNTKLLFIIYLMPVYAIYL
jgi:hypothetical protein